MSVYTRTSNGTHQICGNVKDFGVKVVDCPIWKVRDKDCVNGTFFWHDSQWRTYPTSLLFVTPTMYQIDANHLPYPQSVLIVYNDGRVDMKKISHLSDIGRLYDVRLVIGGIGLRNTQDKSFKYDPASEGFIGKYADVLAKRNKTVIGYNIKEDKMYIMVRPNIAHKEKLPWKYDLLKLVKDCEYDFAISVDGGGSTFMKSGKTTVVHGEETRRIHNVIGFNL